LVITSETPKYPVVLAHGLLGFDELRLAGPLLPGVQYWRGIKEALTLKGVKVITATVPPSGSIETRAEELVKDIDEGAQGKDVNIIAYVFSILIGSRIAFRLTSVQT
jgi:triacylglycerol lipase